MRSGSFVEESLPTIALQERPVGSVRPAGGCDAQLKAKIGRQVAGQRTVPATDEDRRHRSDVGIEPGFDAALDCPGVGIGGSKILLGREEQRDVHRDAGKDR